MLLQTNEASFYAWLLGICKYWLNSSVNGMERGKEGNGPLKASAKAHWVDQQMELISALVPLLCGSKTKNYTSPIPTTTPSPPSLFCFVWSSTNIREIGREAFQSPWEERCRHSRLVSLVFLSSPDTADLVHGINPCVVLKQTPCPTSALFVGEPDHGSPLHWTLRDVTRLSQVLFLGYDARVFLKWWCPEKLRIFGFMHFLFLLWLPGSSKLCWRLLLSLVFL